MHSGRSLDNKYEFESVACAGDRPARSSYVPLSEVYLWLVPPGGIH